MATRIYLPSSGAAAVTPSTWNHANQAGTTYTLRGVLTKGSTTLTSRTTASGTTNPYTRAVMRYVVGPLAAQTIAGTINVSMRCSEANGGANATMSVAVKIIQPGGDDRAVLLAATASDSAASPREFTTTLSSRRAYDVSENRPINLASQDASDGDYLVIELGFRSATGTTYNVVMQHGDNAAADLDDADGDTGSDAPWVDFSQTLTFNTPITPPVGSLAAAGMAVGLLLLGPSYPSITPETGAAYFGLETASSHTITPPAGTLAASGVAPTLGQAFSITPPAGNLALAGIAGKLGIAIAPPVGAVAASGVAPTLLTDSRLTPTVGAAAFTGAAPSLETTTAGDTPRTPGSDALTFSGAAPSLLTPVSLTPSAGGLVASGVAPALFRQTFLTPSAGAVTAAGNAPTLSVASTTSITPDAGRLFFGLADIPVITPPAGALALAGAAPDLEQSASAQLRTPPVAALALTGAAPSLRQDTRITPDTGALRMEPPTLEWTWTPSGGEDVTSWRFKYGRITGTYTNYTDVADAALREIPVRTVVTAGPGPWYLRIYAVGPSGEGSFSDELQVDPGIVELRVDTPRQPGAGALTLTGNAATLVVAGQTRITPDSAALVIAGGTSSLRLQDYRTPPAGALVVAGLAPVMDAPQVIQPATGAVTLAGVLPVVGSDVTITVPASVLAADGAVPTVQRSEYIVRVVTPPTGALAFSGSDPVLSAAQRITVPSGAMTAAGAAPVPLLAVMLTPPSGACAIAGAAPQTIIGPVMIPGTAEDLAFDSAPPVLDQTAHIRITPASGSLAVAGSAPATTETGTTFEAFRLRELPARFAAVETAARYRARELPARYRLRETDRGAA